jgi:hypothetical protein
VWPRKFGFKESPEKASSSVIYPEVISHPLRAHILEGYRKMMAALLAKQNDEQYYLDRPPPAASTGKLPFS